MRPTDDRFADLEIQPEAVHNYVGDDVAADVYGVSYPVHVQNPVATSGSTISLPCILYRDSCPPPKPIHPATPSPARSTETQKPRPKRRNAKAKPLPVCPITGRQSHSLVQTPQQAPRSCRFLDF